MPAEPTALTISSLLADHHNDPHRALATLVSRYNRLAADHATLRQDQDAAVQASERAAQENQQLWRSLKALGSASSPRPSALRQNSDHSAAQGVRGLGLDTPSSRGLRRGPSSESNSARLDLPSLSASFGAGAGGGSSGSGATSQHSSPRADADFTSSSFSAPPPHDGHGAPRSAEPSPRFASAAHFSSPVGRTKAATPPPSHGSPRAHDALAASGLRKASSLDLGRGGPDAAAAVAGAAGSGAGGASAAAAPSSPGEGLRMPHDEQLLPRTPPQGDKAFDPRRRRSSPRMMTGSSSMPMLSDPAMDRRLLPSIQPVSPFFVGGGGNGGDDSGSRSASSRDPNSASSSAGEHLQQQLHHPSGRTADLASSRRDRTFSTNSSTSLATSAFPDPSSSSSPRSATSMLQDSTYSMRERRPSAPSSRLAHAALGPHDTDPAASTSASAPSSRRPSALNFGGAQLAAQQAPAPPPHPPRTPTLRPAPPPAPPSLTPAQLPQARVRVTSSNIRLSERGKEVVSFVVDVELPSSSSTSSSSSSSAAAADPAAAGDPLRWRVEKKYADVLALDAAVRNKASRSEAKNLASLPDKNLFKDHAPHKSDQRKALVERYLQTLVALSLKDRSPVCTFLTSDVVAESPTTPSSAHGAMEGWLTKRGRNFGGWQTRFYVLTPGSALAYYDAPGGNKLGEIPLQSAAIGRQSSSRAQPTASSSSSSSAPNANASSDADDAYLHAFLIRTQSDEKHGHHEADHILCAENDEQRDRWVQALTTLQPRGAGATSSVKAGEKERERALPDAPSAPPPVPTVVSTEPDSPAQPSAPKERRRSGSGPPSSTSALAEQGGSGGGGGLSARSAGEQGLPPSVSLPSDLHALARGMPALEGGASAKKIATTSEANEVGSAQGSSGSSAARSASNKLQAPSSRRPSGDRPLSPSRTESPSSSGAPHPPPPPAPPQPSAAASSTKYSASDVSGPMNAVPLPSGYDFKKAERQKKTKSSFWNFASRGSSSAHHSSGGDRNSASSPGGHAPPARPVFGVPLPEAVAISRIRPGLELPAIVYRCVEYLEAKNAEHEEGIFRLSGSANVIRLLKERFNAEGDVNLLQSADYYDPHAVAGLLKQYLRELPDHLLTRELHNEFLRVIDLRDRRDRVNALGKLVARLPIEEYTLFRFFFAHLCLIAQNADASKMNLRNLGIVFAPTLAIPQPLFSLFLVEFDLIFAVETETGAARPIMVGEEPSTLDSAAPTAGSGLDKSPRSGGNRNSQLYEASGAGELEQKLEKLRENDEADDLPAETGRPGPDEADRAGPPGGEQGAPNETYEQSHSNGPLGAPLRSPGLPVSPRPGATF
ncbi:hypothetical protein JCM9279_002855 [Rhodotorula babjevae]